MDHEIGVLEFEPDEFEQIASRIGPDGEHSRWVGVWLEIENDDGVLKGVPNGRVVDVVPASGPVDLHIGHYRNT